MQVPVSSLGTTSMIDIHFILFGDEPSFHAIDTRHEQINTINNPHL